LHIISRDLFISEGLSLKFQTCFKYVFILYHTTLTFIKVWNYNVAEIASTSRSHTCRNCEIFQRFYHRFEVLLKLWTRVGKRFPRGICERDYRRTWTRVGTWKNEPTKEDKWARVLYSL